MFTLRNINKMNVAIVIGVSKYADAKNDLPGSRNDAVAIYQILNKTEKFGHILYINEDQSSSKTKELLSNFILEQKGKPIEELFFYYSGHGEFVNDEFYYVLADFDAKKRNQTSLQNSEVDDLIRTLSPGLVVKVIDACQSGTTYIKESNVLNKYFNETKQGFKKCYFLNSSLNNQASYQNQELSFFTLSFISSLTRHSTEEIRYKDIIDVISDEFTDNADQTPFFVIQADYTEKFCVISKNMREFLSNMDSIKSAGGSKELRPLSLSDLVKQDAKSYVDKEGAVECVSKVGQRFTEFSLAGDLVELYKVEVRLREDYNEVYHLYVIDKWLQTNKGQYFAISITDYYTDDDTGEEGEYVSGINLKVDVPFKAVTVDINAAFPNLSSYRCNVIFLLSKKYIRFFYYITNFVSESWDNKSLNTKDLKWTTSEHEIGSIPKVLDGIDRIKKYVQQRIENDIKVKFNLNSEESPAVSTQEDLSK
jgi:hypothetical protein